ncbi:MAG: DUF262 domain-containing protein [Flavobacteriaceae bacterium]|nr:DUF262 domain-containing protein [Flavobacteriaceae bacterium]MCY4267791.1 DUF262 domain-containing protein [Flavobacteriaceae bacterium]
MIETKDDIKISIEDFVQGYKNNKEKGVIGYKGRLNIRPEYQRNYIHENNPEFKEKLIQSISKQLPIGLFYWAEKDDGSFELLDGQQRGITIGDFFEGRFSVKLNDVDTYFHRLDKTKQKNFLAYSLKTCIVKGDHNDKMEYFKTINTGSEKLSDQELRNAIYSGPWVNSAKLFFVATSNNYHDHCKKLIPTKGRNRQKNLEIIISWIINNKQNEAICDYMGIHMKDSNANELWGFYEDLVDWVEDRFGETTTFDNTIRVNQNWGKLYHQYKDKNFDFDYTKKRLIELIKIYQNESDPIEGTEYPFVQRINDLYEYILSGETEESRKFINKRKFSNDDIKKKYEEQRLLYANTKNKICDVPNCSVKLKDAQGDHIHAYAKGGRTIYSNLQILCGQCNREKANR